MKKRYERTVFILESNICPCLQREGDGSLEFDLCPDTQPWRPEFPSNYTDSLHANNKFFQ